MKPKVKNIKAHSFLLAPNILLEDNVQLFDWSLNEYLWVALEDKAYLHDPINSTTDLLCEADDQDGNKANIGSVKWMSHGYEAIAIGLMQSKELKLFTLKFIF